MDTSYFFPVPKDLTIMEIGNQIGVVSTAHFIKKNTR